MKKDTWYMLLLLTVVFGVYLVTGYGTVAPYRDSGDLAAAAYSLGISHPPGYVLYVLMGKIFNHSIPWGDAAYRLNIMSIVFGALAVLFLFRIVRIFTGSLAAFTGTVCFALMPALWRLSQTTEMYTVNIFFGALILWWLLKEDNPYRTLWLSALLCGLALTNHQTLMFFFPGYVYLIWKKFPELHDIRLSARILGLSACFFLGGLAVYVFLPVRSITEPVMDWGNPQTLRNFWRMISRSDYGLLKLHPEESILSWSISGIYQQILFFCRILMDQFTPAGICAGCVGMWYAWKKRLFGVSALLFLVSGPGFMLLANLPIENKTSLPILEPNLIMPGLIWAIWIGFGIHYFIEKKNVAMKITALVCALLTISAAAFSSKYHGVYNRDNFLSFDYGKNIFRSLEPGAVLYNPDDPTTFITEYFKMIHKVRLDMRTFVYFKTLWGYHRLKKLYPDIMPAGEQDNAQLFLDKFFKKNRGSIPIYSDFSFKFPKEYNSVPHGILYLLLGEREIPDHASLAESERLLAIYPLRTGKRIFTQDSFFSRQILSYYTSARNNTAIALLGLQRYDAARKQYFSAIALNPLFKEGWSNLGALEYRVDNTDDAEKYFQRALQLDRDNPEDVYNMGLVLKKKEEYDRALEFFKKIPPNSARSAHALNESGLIHLIRGNYEKAVQDFNNAISQYPAYDLPYYNLGLAYQKQGEIEKALQAYREYYRRTTNLSEKEETRALINRLKTAYMAQ